MKSPIGPGEIAYVVLENRPENPHLGFILGKIIFIHRQYL